VGRTVAREFRTSGVPFVILEKEQPRAQWAIQENMPVIIGSASNEETLERARIQHAAGLIAAVTSDADNLYIVLTARGMCPNLKIIARASEEEAAPKLIRAGATQVVSPYHFVGRRIAHLLLRPHVIDLIETAFGNERLDVQIEEVHVPENSPIVGKTLASADIRRKTGVLVLAMRRSDGTLTFNPDLDASIKPGDCLIAIGGAEHLEKLEALAGIQS
jgi:voltage-gated potassium channel